MSVLIEAKAASLRYVDHQRDVYALRRVSLQIMAGEFLGILGPSGSGKSSLLYVLSGLKTASEGEALFEGVRYDELNDGRRSSLRLKRFGFVFQQPYLLGYLTAVENVLAAERGGVDEAEDLLDRLGLGEKRHRLPHELSGGERQRVCVARALIGSPAAIFADEPTASLDHANGLSVVNLLNEHRGPGALVMVTHDPSMLADADRVVRIADGEVESDEAAVPAKTDSETDSESGSGAGSGPVQG